jgi:hypothetical protein
MHTLTFKDDERGRKLLQTFDTTAGVGMRGGRGRGDLKSKKSGIPWKYFLLAMVVVPVVVGAVLNFGMHGLLNKVQHKVAPHLPGVAPVPGSTSSAASVASSLLPGFAPPSGAPVSDDKVATTAVHQPLPFWNLDGDTNLQVVGWLRDPSGEKFFLSNGRELPAFVVKSVNPYFVLLNDGEFIPVSRVSSDSRTGQTHFSNDTVDQAFDDSPRLSSNLERRSSSDDAGISPAPEAGRLNPNVVPSP